jgi:hypothetical protein
VAVFSAPVTATVRFVKRHTASEASGEEMARAVMSAPLANITALVVTPSNALQRSKRSVIPMVLG